MKVVRLETKDFYDTMTIWWEAHSFPTIDIDVLPKYTFVCYVGGYPVYSCCLYETDSKLAWVAWQISNTSIPYHMKAGGLEYLFHEIGVYAKEKGFKVLFTTSGTPSVIEALESQCFSKGDENVKHYIKNI